MNQRLTITDRLRGLRKRMRALFQRASVEDEMASELAFHMEMETRRNIESGMSESEARTAAMRAFGGVDRFAEDVRDVRRFSIVDDAWQDAKHACRSFMRTPGYAAAAILTLALGSGANIAIFCVADALLLKPLPYEQPERLVRVWEANPTLNVDHGSFSPGTFVDLRKRSHTLERIALYNPYPALFTFDRVSAELVATSTTPSLFEMLGRKPLLGRMFTEDPGNDTPQEALISYDVWRNHFGGARDVVGKTMRIEGKRAVTVIGVMPRGFHYPARTDVWTAEDFPSTFTGLIRQLRYYDVTAQLREGASVEDAQRELASLAKQLETEYPASNAGWTTQVSSLTDSIVGNARPTLLVLLALVGCLLLIACTNVASLAVARTTARAQEIGVRVAIGAGKQRLVRQWIVEGCVLATAGSAVGIALAYSCIHILRAVAPADMPRLEEITFAPAVLVFALLLTCVTAVATSVAPVFQLRRLRMGNVLRNGARSTARETIRAREWLNGAEVALTLVLLVCASLLLSSFAHLRAIDLGFRSEGVMSAAVRIPLFRFTDRRPWARMLEHHNEMLQRIGSIPGVTRVAGVSGIPLSGQSLDGALWRTDAPGAVDRHPPTSAADQWHAQIEVVTPKYFDVMSIPVLRGRRFNDADAFTVEQLSTPQETKPTGVAIVNAAAAQRFWPGENPIGKQITLFDDQSFAASRTVVGLSGDVRATDVAQAAQPAVYIPIGQRPGPRLSIVANTTLPPARFEAAVLEVIRNFDPQVSVSRIEPMAGVVSSSVARPRFNAMLVAAFALVALILSATGIFGVMGYLVTLRTSEIGIRMALGARRSAVLQLVMLSGMRSVVIGMITGSALALFAATAMRSLLFGLQPLDPVSFLAAWLVLTTTCTVAAALPALRAANLDPVGALRSS